MGERGFPLGAIKLDLRELLLLQKNLAARYFYCNKNCLVQLALA
jgi:hypothetical protein